MIVTDRARCFKGLGRAEARETNPVKLEINKKVIWATFFVLEQTGFPILIGTRELKALDFMVDPVKQCLVDRAQHWQAMAVEEGKEDEQGSTSMADVVSGVCESQTDEQLLVVGRRQIEQASVHLPNSEVSRIWSLFERYQGCWLRPRSGRVNVLKARFTVQGPPIKQKLRALTDPLKQELETQISAMLKAGVIRPSKSPWGSVPVFVRKKTGEYRMCLC